MRGGSLFFGGVGLVTVVEVFCLALALSHVSMVDKRKGSRDSLLSSCRCF
jgi:hypothetical protein